MAILNLQQLAGHGRLRKSFEVRASRICYGLHHGLRTIEERFSIRALLPACSEINECNGDICTAGKVGLGNVVRPAQAKEIQFYWATIPFDIEEPFFAIETPSDVFVANLRFNNGSPVLLWLDRVDDLRTLHKK